MPRKSVQLTDTACRNAKPQAKMYKIYDTDGLYLKINPTGSKLWCLKYYFAKKENMLGFGRYPDVTLTKAREYREEAKRLLRNNQDPSLARKRQRLDVITKHENTFEIIAREWLEMKKKEWVLRHWQNTLNRFEANIFPHIGSMPITEIDSVQLLDVLRRIEKRGANDIAKRAAQSCGQIFRYAITQKRGITHNPALGLTEMLAKVESEHFAHLSADDLPEFLKKLETASAEPLTLLAFKLNMLTFLRPAEMRESTWSCIDLDQALWRIEKGRMKMRREHLVPLSQQAIALLREVQKISGEGDFIFPNQYFRGRTMSENTLLNVIYKLGYKHRATVHGWRHTASTILNENEFLDDAIEKQLAHDSKNKIRVVYNHAKHLTRRREMMQWWADHLDEVRGK